MRERAERMRGREKGGKEGGREGWTGKKEGAVKLSEKADKW